MSDEEDDPFEQFEESVGDREGDPFDHLEAEDGSEDDDSPETEEAFVDDESERDPLAGPDEPDRPDYDGHDVTPAGHRDESDDEGEVVEQSEPSIDAGPGQVEESGIGDVSNRQGDPFDDDVFEEMDVGDVDPDEVWESMSDAQRRGSVADAHKRKYAEVSKHRYCEQCEHFSDPPEVKCSHDGTEIMEFVDNDTVRLVDCPIVAERKRLEERE